MDVGLRWAGFNIAEYAYNLQCAIELLKSLYSYLLSFALSFISFEIFCLPTSTESIGQAQPVSCQNTLAIQSSVASLAKSINSRQFLLQNNMPSVYLKLHLVASL